MISNQISEFYLGVEVTEKLEIFFDDIFKREELIYNELNVFTRNGIQTKNVINFFDSLLLEKISIFIKKYIGNCYHYNLISYNFFVDHIHLIKYAKDGYQISHTHHMFEDHSFIIYLNDSNAVTRIYHRDSYSDIENKKGKMVVFNSALFHGATKCDNTRNILVGSIKFTDKKWIDRRNMEY